MVPEIWSTTKLFLILNHFLPFYPNSNPKSQNFEKMKKAPWDIIILHKCTKNHYHMLCCSWDMACDGCNSYFSFEAIFCPFTPLTAQKVKINKKKWKKCLEISSFYICVPKIMIRWYTVPEIWCTTDKWTDGQTQKVTYRGGCPSQKNGSLGEFYSHLVVDWSVTCLQM